MKKLTLLFCFIILLCPLALPQEISGSYTVDRNETQVKHLLDLLNTGKMQEAIKCFYGEGVIYDKDLADLLVFVDKTKRSEKPIASDQCLQKDTSVKFAILKSGKYRTDLFGEKFLYLMVFIAEKTTDPYSVGKNILKKELSRTVTTTPPDSPNPTITDIATEKSTETSPLTIRQSSLDYKLGSGEFFLISMITAVLKSLGGASLDSSKKTENLEEMKEEPLKMEYVGCTEDKTALYFGYMRLKLVENTINRFTVVETRSDKKTYHHLATFGNYCSSIFGSSMGFTGTFVGAKQREELSDKRFPINAFLFGHFYIKRPRLPAPHYQDSPFLGHLSKKYSLSFVLGTAIKQDPLDDLFVGFGVGHLYETLGLVVGWNYRTVPKTSGDKTEKERKPHFCIGVSFTL